MYQRQLEKEYYEKFNTTQIESDQGENGITEGNKGPKTCKDRF